MTLFDFAVLTTLFRVTNMKMSSCRVRKPSPWYCVSDCVTTGRYRQLDSFCMKVSLAIYHFAFNHTYREIPWNYKTSFPLNRQRTIYQHQPCPSSNARSAYYIEMMRTAARFSTFPTSLRLTKRYFATRTSQVSYESPSDILQNLFSWTIRMFESESARNNVAKLWRGIS